MTMKDYVFVGWLIIVIFGVLSMIFAPMFFEKKWSRKRDKERAERRKQVNDKLAELFPLALAEMKKKWKDITDDIVKTNAYGTGFSFYYRGSIFYLFVNNLNFVEIDRNDKEVGTIAYHDVDHYIKTFGILFNEVDGDIEKLERVANRLATKLVDLHVVSPEWKQWKLVKDIDCGDGRIKVLERLEHRLVLKVQECQISATIRKDGKVWANYFVEIKDGIDHFDAVNKVFGKVVQWEEFM